MTDKPGPFVLWRQADEEHPDNPVGRRLRYRELMIEHGHLIPKEAPDDHG